MSFSNRPAGTSMLKRKHFVTLLSDLVETDYQREVIVHKSAGSDSGVNVYLGVNVQDAFGDVRFVKGDEITLLDYMRIDYTSGVSARMWTEVHKAGHSLLTGDSGADKVFDVSDGSVFAVNDWVIVLDDDTLEGELHQIDSINVDEITLKTALSQSYTAAQNARCCHVGFIYYEDAGASDASDGDNTFPWFFDDLDAYSVNDSLALPWTYTVNPPDTINIQQDPVDAGKKVIQHHETGGGTYSSFQAQLGGSRNSVRLYHRIRYSSTGGNNSHYFHPSGAAVATNFSTTYGAIRYYSGVAYVDFSPSLTMSTNTWYDMEWRLYDVVNKTYFHVIRDALDGTGGFRSDSVPTGVVNFSITAYHSVNTYFYVGGIGDNDRYVFATKFRSTEPTWGTWGSEEEYYIPRHGFVNFQTPGVV